MTTQTEDTNMADTYDYTGLVAALRAHWQIDEDGTECGVSRQAVCEAADCIERLRTELAGARAGAERVAVVAKTLSGISSKAYCDYTAQMSKDECLGWEHKVATGKFGWPEIDAHCEAARLLSLHRTSHDAAVAIDAALSQVQP